MAGSRDPIQHRADESTDLYDISEWESRSLLDRISVLIYTTLLVSARAVVIFTAALIFAAEIALGALGLLNSPIVGLFVVFSALPALGLAWYVRHADATTPEPLELLVKTFLLGVFFATFAGILNSALGAPLGITGPDQDVVSVASLTLFFFVVVGPVEETVKLLAVRLGAYRSERFNAVVDGAVYGAFAGLGFATIENALYITRAIPTLPNAAQLIGIGGSVATVRALAGPGHVIYSAFAGYYLGLAKFNPGDRGPIVIKGLLIASLIHAVYNTSVSFLVPGIAAVTPIGTGLAFLGFVLLYDGLFGYLLWRKISRYSRAYRNVTATSAD
jgi:RsiW-degrading membrane proteinase PrsW (M82 family)